MNLTFKGFLRGYCRELTGCETDNLRKLLSAVLSDSSATAEALMCFAVMQDKGEYLARLASGSPLEADYQAAARAAQGADSLQTFLCGDEAPDRYKKVWLAYRSKKDAVQADRRVIALMREKTLEAMSRTQRTAYSLCSELDLNRGNVYAYLNGGDVTKVSRTTARRLMEAACA